MAAPRRWFLVAALAAVAAAALVLASRFRAGGAPAVAVGEEAPDFAARTVFGEPELRSLSDYEGYLLLVNVWATWCTPCREEMPSIQRLYREYRDHGLRVVAVSVDDAGQQESIREFVEEFDLTFDILHDDAGAILDTFQMLGLPGTYLIDPEGRIRDKVIGGADWYSAEKRALVERWLPGETS